MLKIDGYTFIEKIADGPHVLVCRAFSEKLKHNVVLKVLRAEFPTSNQVKNFEAEFELLKSAPGEGIPRAYELLVINKTRVLVLEDVGGVSLGAEMKTSALTLREKTRIALAITKALATLQANGIIHRDIKPDNVVIEPGGGRLQIVDLGLARKAVKLAAEEGLAGTLQYIAPEQTGRTQNAVDYRSDYYSLGVTLYELYAGRLPFSAHDEMEWVHSHIAIAETPLVEVNREIPLPISLIVQKLMKKSPDERYQSCLGILRDLENCLDMKSPESFRAGTNDVSSEFKLSSKLYGREDEIKIMNRVHAQVVLGGKRLILVDGDPGVGKSSLVNVVKESVRKEAGYFIFGKFDQFRKDIPFSALIQALNQLVAQILTEGDSGIRAWKEKIMIALGENAAVVTDILPQVELIIGKIPPVHQLEGSQQRQRFQQTFHAFIRACCERGRPLVIFLDDLQWADSASRALMQMFLTEKDAESMLFIGAYRRGEITASHPLRQLIAEIKDKEIGGDEIHLNGLSLDHINALVNDSFPVATGDRESLSRLVHGKTNGNPFFVTQFFSALYDKRLLRFDPFTGWTWDLEKIHREDVTSNVLELLNAKIEHLAVDTQEVLQLAACFGSYFKVEELKSYNQKSDIENSILLQPAVQAGLISSGERGNYKFIHDRVQEAAYGMMSEGARANIHYQIAKRLLSVWNTEKVREGIFYLVNHLNAGTACITTEEERERGSEINWLAAQRAKDSSVYDLAYNYSVCGIELLSSDDWNKYGRLLKPLMIIRATSEYAMGRHDEADQTFRAAVLKVSNDLERAQIYRLMVELAHVRDQNGHAIDLCITALKLVGVKIPKNPPKLRLLFMILSARRLLLKRLHSQMPERNGPPSEHEKEILALLATMSAPAYTVNKNLLAYVCLKSVLISLRGGYFDLGPRSLLLVYLWYVLGDFGTVAKSAGQLVKFAAEADPKDVDLKGAFGLYVFAMHIAIPYKETIKALDRTSHLMALHGNVLYRALTALNAGILTLFSERKLEKSSEKFAGYMKTVRLGNYGVGTALAMELMVSSWRGIDDPGLSDENVREEIAKLDSPMPRAWYGLTRMYRLAMSADYKTAFDEIKDYDEAIANIPFAAFSVNSRAFSTVVRLKNIGRVSGLAKLKQLFKIRANINFFRKLSDTNPGNFKAAYLILAGEWDAMRGRYVPAIRNLQAAILAAKKSEIVLYEPFANELLADVFFKQGLDQVGMLCLRDALFLYETWGAKGLVASLTARFPLLEVAPDRGSISVDSTVSHASTQQLDLNTVLKATNTLISEIEMHRLVEKMLNILIENAGAERGVLFLLENQQLIARGEIAVNSADEFKLINVKIDDYANVPRAMVSYVARTHETMVLENSSEDDRLSRDEYVRRNQVLSSVCLPILAQGELRGMVYLENNAAKGVFSPERVELMTILSGQIAISLENARLYQQRGEAIRMQNELVTAHAVQEMLFPPSQFACPGVKISGHYQPATECGGDWWSYSKIGDWIYCYIGDATGHGAPAAFVTSAACSAVSVIEEHAGVTPERAMSLLNKAVCRATKGQIDMTFFVGALNSLTGEFRYVRASHEPPMLLRKEKLAKGVSMRACLEPLMGSSGLSLGKSADEQYVSTSIQLEPGDTIVLYTDGLPEVVNKKGEVLGERGFWQIVHQACIENGAPEGASAEIVEKVQAFRNEGELLDDITLCILQYTGEAMRLSRVAI